MHSDVVRLEQQLEVQRHDHQRSDSVIAANVAGLARLLQTVADSVAVSQTAVAQLKGDLRTELYNVQQQLVAIQELTGQSQQRLSELRGQLDQTQRQLPAGSQPAPAAPAQPVTPGGDAQGMREPTADQLIDISVGQLRRGSPGAARVGFAEFVRKYPDNPRMADVLFMTGEAWSAENRGDSAAVAYRAVVQRFPQSPRAPSALYKLALQSLAAGRTSDARDDLNRVVTGYPQSPEAGLARDRLRSLPAR
ncbi:MAG: tetratricopeptide repeat protein [Gemmatimonadales bacterium]